MPSITTFFSAARENVLRTAYTRGLIWTWRNVGNVLQQDGSLCTFSGPYLGQVVNLNNTPTTNSMSIFGPLASPPAGSYIVGFQIRIRKVATSTAPSTIIAKDSAVQIGFKCCRCRCFIW